MTSSTKNSSDSTPPLNVIRTGSSACDGATSRTAESDQQARPPTDVTKHAGEGDNGAQAVSEIGGPKGPEPTRYGDWERKGRCVDF